MAAGGRVYFHTQREGSQRKSGRAIVTLRWDPRSKEQTELGTHEDSWLLLRTDGSDVYEAAKEGVLKLPAQGRDVVLEHRFGPEDEDTEDFTVVGGDVWLKRVHGSGASLATEVVAFHRGSTESFARVSVAGPALRKDNFFVSSEWVALVSGSPRTLVVWPRTDRTHLGPRETFPLPPRGQKERPAVDDKGELDSDERASVALTPKTLYVMVGTAAGYQVLSLAPHQAGPSLVHQGKEEIHSSGALTQDGRYLYFSYAPLDRRDNEIALVRLAKSGGRPEPLGTIHEGTRLVIDGNDLYGRGGAGGSIYRIHLR